MKRHKITKIDEGGIAEELGIEEGDFLLAINDKEIEDIFDYDFIVNDEYLEVLIEKADGEEWLSSVRCRQSMVLSRRISSVRLDHLSAKHATR